MPAPGTIPPPGYVAYGAPGSQQLARTAGLRTATIVLFWATVAANVLLAIVLFWRRTVWDDFIAGNANFLDLDDADNTVGVVGIVGIGLSITAAIVLAIWSLRTARNARSRGAIAVSPGWACGGWFIPIGNLWVGFGQLRKAVDAMPSGTAPALGRWQAAWIAATVFGFATRSFFDIDSFDAGEISSTLQNQSVVGAIQAIASAVAAFFAMRAMREIDQAVSTQPA